MDIRTSAWMPSDNQMIHLLLQRGWLERDTVARALADQKRRRAASALELLVTDGVITTARLKAVLAGVREDEAVRELARRGGLIDEAAIAEAGRRQRGTRRTLLETLEQERLGSLEARATLRDTLAPGGLPPEPPPRPGHAGRSGPRPGAGAYAV